jgi:hypothetical protein
MVRSAGAEPRQHGWPALDPVQPLKHLIGALGQVCLGLLLTK